MTTTLRKVPDGGLARAVREIVDAITLRGDCIQGITVERGHVCVRYIEHVTGKGAVAVVGAIDPRSLELFYPRRNVVAPAHNSRLRLRAVNVDEARVRVGNE